MNKFFIYEQVIYPNLVFSTSQNLIAINLIDYG